MTAHATRGGKAALPRRRHERPCLQADRSRRRCSKLSRASTNRRLATSASCCRTRTGARSRARGARCLIPTVEGLDSADGLLRVAGNRKLYLKLLRQFSVAAGRRACANRRAARRPATEPRRSEPRTPSRASLQISARERYRAPRANWRRRSTKPPTPPGWKRCASSCRPCLHRSSTGCALHWARNRRLRRAPAVAVDPAQVKLVVAQMTSTWPSSMPRPRTVLKPITAYSPHSSPPKSLPNSSSTCRATPSARRTPSCSKQPGRSTHNGVWRNIAHEFAHPDRRRRAGQHPDAFSDPQGAGIPDQHRHQRPAGARSAGARPTRSDPPRHHDAGDGRLRNLPAHQGLNRVAGNSDHLPDGQDRHGGHRARLRAGRRRLRRQAVQRARAAGAGENASDARPPLSRKPAAAAQRAARHDRRETQAAGRHHRGALRRRHRAVRRHRRLHPDLGPAFADRTGRAVEPRVLRLRRTRRTSTGRKRSRPSATPTWRPAA